MATWRKTLSSNQYYEVILNVNQDSQNIANNTSNISWNLQVRKTYGSGFWGLDNTASTWSVNIDGTDVSSGSGSYDFRGGAPLTKTISSGTITITHSGDGSKSIAVSGYWKDNVNGLGNATASGTMALSTIPRATELTAFSFAAHLENGVANAINYTVSRKSGDFRHQIELRDGSTTVFAWDNISSDGASTITLTASNVNTLLTRMPTSTTKTFTLRVSTRSGVNGWWVGAAVSINATATVHADVKPTISGQRFGISGMGIDQTMAKYIQGFTKVDALFTPTAGYGSSIQSSSMTVQKTDGSDSQVISGNIGTTGRAVLSSGEYRVIYTTTDTRGRSTSAVSPNFIVHAYSAPVISAIALFRYDHTPTIVYVGVAGHFSSLDTSNVATLRIERKNGDTWEQVTEDTLSVTGWIKKEVNVPNNSITSSYEYRAILTDYVNGRAEVIDTISTQQIVMDIYRNQGVAFGKFYEPDKGGVVQVGGPATFDDYLRLSGSGSDTRIIVEPDSGNGSIEIGSVKGASTPYIDFHSSGYPNDFDSRIIAMGGTQGMFAQGLLDFQSRDIMVNNVGVVSSGVNDRGTWTKFYDGTLICTTRITLDYADVIVLQAAWWFPHAFVNENYRVTASYLDTSPMKNVTPIGLGARGGSVVYISCQNVSSTFTTSDSAPVEVMAIGRWK